ncbi:hypothetical protein FQZ97_674010 [compost metagenome]
MPEGAGRAADAEEVLDIDAVHHHAAEQQHAFRRPTQVLEAPAQATAVVLHHLQGAATVGGAFFQGVVVRREGAQGVGQFAVLFEKVQRLAAVPDEGLHQRGIEAGANGLAQVGADGFGTVLDTGGSGLVAVEDPGGTAGNGRGASEAGGLLHHQYLEALAGGGGGRGETGGAAAEDDQVVGARRAFGVGRLDGCVHRVLLRRPAASRPYGRRGCPSVRGPSPGRSGYGNQGRGRTRGRA